MGDWGLTWESGETRESGRQWSDESKGIQEL